MRRSHVKSSHIIHRAVLDLSMMSPLCLWIFAPAMAPEQMGQLRVSTPAVPQEVHAWILWEDGVEELVQAHAIAWTKRAVRVRLRAPPHQHEVWVWAGSVERA
jgi:hypothetical protein